MKWYRKGADAGDRRAMNSLGELYADDEGLEFRTQREAEIEATQTLSGLARDLAGHEDRTDVAIEVRTDAGRVFQAALIFEPPTTKQ